MIEFNINGEFWHLEFVSPNDSILIGYDGNYTLGVTDLNTRTIYLSDNLYGELLHRVLSHELAHAEFAARGLILPIYIEEAMADIITDNIIDIKDVAECIHNNLCRYYNKC